MHERRPYEALNKFLDTLDTLCLRLTYPEVRLHSNYSDVAPSSARLDSRFSERVPVRVPIIGAAMDTVTEALMAIALAEYGGLGVIHRAMTPKEQAAMVARVKHRQNGRLDDPIVVREEESVAQLLKLRKDKGYDFHRFPVIDSVGAFVGLVSKKDLQFCTDHTLPISAVMTPREQLVVADARTGKEAAYTLMCERKKEALPLLATDGTLVALYLFEDLERIFKGGSHANVDANDQLRVGAAIGVDDLERALLLLEKKCDVLVVDTAHGHSSAVRKMVEAVRAERPDADIVAGNISSPEAALALAEWGVNGVKVGQGPGSICTTRTVAGIGAPQASAVGACARVLRESGFGHIPVCADGGVVDSGDIVVALALGAHTVMLGNLLAGTDEAPGEVVYDTRGNRTKKYRGMGSRVAMLANLASRERYGQGDVESRKLVAEGVEAEVPYKGSVSGVLDRLVGGVRQGAGYLGVYNIAELPRVARPFRVSQAGVRESGAHDVRVLDGT